MTEGVHPAGSARGVVYLAHRSSGGGDPRGPAWSGDWERWDPPGVLGEGSWATAGEAIDWARERSAVVIVRVDMPPRLFRGADVDPPGESLAAWPPPDVDRFDP